MLFPHLSPRVEQKNKIVGFRIIPRHIAAFGGVATRAGQTGVLEARRAAVFARSDVVDLVWKRG